MITSIVASTFLTRWHTQDYKPQVQVPWHVKLVLAMMKIPKLATPFLPEDDDMTILLKGLKDIR
jgi:hypothetical protein